MIEERVSTPNLNNSEPTGGVDAVVVGAGLAGVYMLYRLRELGFSTRVFEAGSDVGGTWYWNRYPGARCDIESLSYSYSFSDDLEQEWEWTERYATQPEILRYIQHTVERFDLRPHITFDCKVVSAVHDEAANRWEVTTDSGERVRAQFCIMATGSLSAAKLPEIDGIDSFEGNWYHTGHWPHEGVDFSGQRVAVIGTGSSGVQVIPLVAEQAADLTVFQRTPNFSIPARNAPLAAAEQAKMKANYREYREESRRAFLGFPVPDPEYSALEVDEAERESNYERLWQLGSLQPIILSYTDLGTNLEANDTIAEFVRRKIRSIVEDPGVAELLSPRDHPFGTKRPCLDTNYYATYNLSHVHLTDLRKTPIVTVTPKGIRTTEREFEFDSLIFATGYDALTGALARMDIRGRDNVSLVDKWVAGPRTYLGVASAGFPNLFIVTGPGSPSVLNNVMVAIEQHVEWIGDLMAYMREHGYASFDPTVQAENAWTEHVQDVAKEVLASKVNSWYMGANVPGKPRLFMPYAAGGGVYRDECNEVVAKGYEGFTLQKDAVTR